LIRNLAAAIALILALGASPKPTGSVAGLVTWQYNSLIGTKADVGAGIALIPKGVKVATDDVKLLVVGLNTGDAPAALRKKYGIITGKADGSGAVIIDAAPAGHYGVLIVSAQTTRSTDDGIANAEASAAGIFFSSQAGLAAFNGGRLTEHEGSLRTCAVTAIDVRAGQTTHFSHDFGHAYSPPSTQ
jgi:hypothetical protein